MDALFSNLKNLDAYPKINEDFYKKTLVGGIITIVSSIVMLILFVSELMLSVDAMDISGQQHLDNHDIIKKRIDAHGKVIQTRQDGIGHTKIEKPLQSHGGRLEHNETYCGSCYGAELSVDDCYNTCEELQEAYRKKGWGLSNPDSVDQCKMEGFLQRIKDEEGEGCDVYGFLEVNKVGGNFHFAPGKSFQQSNMHVHDLMSFQKDSFNISHTVNKLVFGENVPGVDNPLDGGHSGQYKQCNLCFKQSGHSGQYQSFIKMVPTVYMDINGHTTYTNQFSVTEHLKADNSIRYKNFPGVFFYYDLSPVKVTSTEQYLPFLHLLTNICAIIGGIFTVSGILDSFIYHSQRAIKQKIELGKFN